MLVLSLLSVLLAAALSVVTVAFGWQPCCCGVVTGCCGGAPLPNPLYVTITANGSALDTYVPGVYVCTNPGGGSLWISPNQVVSCITTHVVVSCATIAGNTSWTVQVFVAGDTGFNVNPTVVVTVTGDPCVDPSGTWSGLNLSTVGTCTSLISGTYSGTLTI